MTRELSESEFIELFSETTYQETVDMAFETMRETPEWKNNKPVIHSIMIFPLDSNDNKKWNLIVEATGKKLVRSGMLAATDFGIVKLTLTDEEMPDEFLDRYNEFMKVNEKIKKEDERKTNQDKER